MYRSAFLLAGIVVAATAGPAPALERAVQDDRELVHWPTSGSRTLLGSVAGWGVSHVRMIVYPDVPFERYAVAVAAARRSGLRVQVVLHEQRTPGHLGPEAFGEWVEQVAPQLAARGVERFSVLNEPDLLLPASGSCRPDEVRSVVEGSGLASHLEVIRSWQPVRRVIDGRRSARPLLVRVPAQRSVRRVLTTSAGQHRKVVLSRRMRAVTRRVLRLTLPASSEAVVLTERQACPKAQRAALAARYYRSAIPKLRSAAPGAEVLIGETSPVLGIEAFLLELAAQEWPRADGFAHHPYPNQHGQTQAGGLWLDRTRVLRRLLDERFGGLPVYFTEFGVRVRDDRVAWSSDRAAAIWADAFREACAVGARQLLAYQLMPTPAPADPDWPAPWDSGLLGPGAGETPAARLFAGFRGC